MRNKKGQLGSLVGIVSTILVIGLFIGAGLVINQEISEREELFDSKVAPNETGAWANTSNNYILDVENGAQTRNFVLVSAYTSMHETCEGTDTDGLYNYSVALGNFTVNANSGRVINASTFNSTILSNVSLQYTYEEGSESWTSVNDTIEAITTVPNLLGLIILIAMVGIILAVVFNIIPVGRQGVGA